MQRILVAILFCTVLLCTHAATCWRGVNLSGMEFGKDPGVFGKDYTTPTNQEVDYFTGKGMNIFRFPFIWERLQTTPNSTLDAAYLGHMDDFVKYATGKNAVVLLDVHNYARYHGQVIGDTLPVGSFANLWSQLADHYKANTLVWFGLMNEPHAMQTELWLSDANVAIAAIRATGASNVITVPGNGWTGAWAWTSNGYGTPNSQVMRGVKDPQNNFIFEVHQYMDTDGSGSHEECVSATIGSQRLEVFTAWARQYGYKAILGEWGGGRTTTCYSAVADITAYMEKNADIYVGWTWWGGGPWWGEYMFALDVDACGKERPQFQYLEPHLGPGKC